MAMLAVTFFSKSEFTPCNCSLIEELLILI